MKKFNNRYKKKLNKKSCGKIGARRKHAPKERSGNVWGLQSLTEVC